VIWLLPLFLLGLSGLATAQETPATDPRISSVVSGGYWEGNGEHGFYRVIVFTGGYEHVSSWVTAEWVREPRTNTEMAAVRTSRQLVGPGFFSLGAPLLSSEPKRVRVRLEGVRTHEPELHVTCIYDLLPNGESEEAQECK